jgi:long-chain-fatty-acid--CoA ligase ACSBG
LVSYLPLSHAAALFFDVFIVLFKGHHLYFADSKALQGTLFETVREVKPNLFFSVPRIWEKVYAQIQQVQKSKTGLAAKVFSWALSIG